MQHVTTTLPEAPNAGWADFPCVQIPHRYSFGHVVHYLVESCPFLYVAPNGRKDPFDHDADGLDNPEDSVHDVDGGARFDDSEKHVIKDRKQFRKGLKPLNSGHVGKVEDGFAGNYYLFRANVKPTMRKGRYAAVAVISRASGGIVRATCTCKARALGRCVHVSALLPFVLRHIKTCGKSGK